MSTYRSTRAADVQAANDLHAERTLTCAAHGCPNRWTVQTEGPGLCSAHAWTDQREWPAITEHERWSETERAREGKGEDRRNPAPPLTLAEKRDLLGNLRTMFLEMRDGIGRRDWAHALETRERAGKRLTLAQREMWRAALGAIRGAA